MANKKQFKSVTNAKQQPKKKKPTKQELLDGIDSDGHPIKGAICKSYLLDKVNADIKYTKTIDKYMATKNVIKIVTDKEPTHADIIKYQEFAINMYKDIKNKIKELTVKDLEELKGPMFDWGRLDCMTLKDDENLQDTLIKQIIEANLVIEYNNNINSLAAALANCED